MRSSRRCAHACVIALSVACFVAGTVRAIAQYQRDSMPLSPGIWAARAPAPFRLDLNALVPLRWELLIEGPDAGAKPEWDTPIWNQDRSCDAFVAFFLSLALPLTVLRFFWAYPT